MAIIIFAVKDELMIKAGTLNILAIILIGVLAASCSGIARWRIKSYHDPYHEKIAKAGFVEKTVNIGVTNLAYTEGPDNGPALLLLHAQLMDWFDYSRVLPELSRSYHIFVVDYNGHGKTTAPASTMNANAIGRVLAAFMEEKIKIPAFVSGNSSGGLLTVWLAANRPDLVRAILLEDPPLFSAEYPRVKNTIAYKSFITSHQYLSSGSKADFIFYWINASKPFIEKNAGKNAAPRLLAMIEASRKHHPGQPVELPFIPVMLRMFFRGMSQFDPNFGEAFYTGEWNKGFDHAAALRKIQCPALLLQANYKILPDGMLDGAMDGNDARKAMSLIKDGKYEKVDAAHVVHLDKPKLFIEAMNKFFLKK